ncbi:hypothetical protein CCH79_00020048 [Gambusia affinis]|uniref:C2H2-type domain-containing protein n=1 Tax=Gambusia affinis TaxID=33528 RepID=A0A315VAG2_GAMAF|nr:hypothetical protein CCH79_00020048 [Gambusia affinis]
MPRRKQSHPQPLKGESTCGSAPPAEIPPRNEELPDRTGPDRTTVAPDQRLQLGSRPSYISHHATGGPAARRSGSELLHAGRSEEEEVREFVGGASNEAELTEGNASQLHQLMGIGRELPLGAPEDRSYLQPAGGAGASSVSISDPPPALTLTLCDLTLEGGAEVQPGQVHPTGAQRRQRAPPCSPAPEKPHGCPHCTYASSHLDNLRRHLRVHTGEKPFRCVSCSYACGNLANLRRHQRIHSGAKPFRCAVCGHRCNQSMNLKRHMLRHTGRKPHACARCGYATAHWDNYKRHQRKHAAGVVRGPGASGAPGGHHVSSDGQLL